jgi:hypothetical protein
MHRGKCDKIVTTRLTCSSCKNCILSSKRRYWSVCRFTSYTERLGGGEVDAEQRALFPTIFDKIKFLSYMYKVQSACNTIQPLFHKSPGFYTLKNFKARIWTWIRTAVSSEECLGIKVTAISVNLSAPIARTMDIRVYIF